MGAVTVRVVHVNHREHGGCVNDVVDWSLPVRELPPPRGDEQVQHLHNEKLAPQGHPASPVPPWPRTRLQVTCGGRAPHAANSTVVSTPVANRRGPATYLLPRPWPARADIMHRRTPLPARLRRYVRTQLLPLAASSRARGCCSFHKQCVKHVVVDNMTEVTVAVDCGQQTVEGRDFACRSFVSEPASRCNKGISPRNKNTTPRHHSVVPVTARAPIVVLHKLLAVWMVLCFQRPPRASLPSRCSPRSERKRDGMQIAQPVST